MRYLLLLLSLAALGEAAPKPIRVCATTQGLGSIARSIGGEHVKTTVFTRPAEDPHFVEAKPSFIRALNRADVLFVVGLDLEIGWLPVLFNNARNRHVMPGQPTYVDCSAAILPKEVPTGIVDRVMGDVHPSGNPHYLLDPSNGRNVARLVRDALIHVRPEARATFEKNHAAFVKSIDAKLKEWQRIMAPHKGAKVVTDHRAWRYFLDRFGLASVGQLEPKPGVQPTSRHMLDLVKTMKAEKVKAILTLPYFRKRYSEFVAERTQAKVVPMAHQPGALPGTDDYVAMVDHNVRSVAAALK